MSAFIPVPEDFDPGKPPEMIPGTPEYEALRGEYLAWRDSEPQGRTEIENAELEAG